MITMNIDKWIQELISCSGLNGEVENNKFDKLISMVEGNEDSKVLSALIDSIQPIEDYGVYESLHNIFWSFSPTVFAEVFVKKFPNLLKRVPTDSPQEIGRFLCPLGGWAKDSYLPIFKSEIKSTSPESRRLIENWFSENIEWFGDVSVLS